MFKPRFKCFSLLCFVVTKYYILGNLHEREKYWLMVLETGRFNTKVLVVAQGLVLRPVWQKAVMCTESRTALTHMGTHEVSPIEMAFTDVSPVR